MILWFGWYGFNTGSVYFITSENQATLAQNAAINTTLAAASGAISSLLAKAWLVERSTGEALFSLSDTLMGCLSGLVGIGGGCAYVESWAAIIIGFVAGILYLAGSNLIIRLGIDDAVDAVSISGLDCVHYMSYFCNSLSDNFTIQTDSNSYVLRYLGKFCNGSLRSPQVYRNDPSSGKFSWGVLLKRQVACLSAHGNTMGGGVGLFYNVPLLLYFAL